jgi:hypothetical protein
MGVDAGRAWASVAQVGELVAFEAGCTSAPWLASLYPVDDRLGSRWAPGVGSRTYTTRYREGQFQQDETVRFGPDAVRVTRGQRFDDGWRQWEDSYPGVTTIEDPVSAFYRLRDEAGPVGERLRWQVWTGKRAATVEVWTAAAEAVDGRPALRVEVWVPPRGDLEPKMTVWVSDDADRAPLVAEVRTRAGPVRATLTRRELGG